MPTLHVLRVFTAPDGSGGNPLGVFLDGGAIAATDRQRVAADLGFSETVFVDDAGRGACRIFTPVAELEFAGHPSVGTAWLLARERSPVDALRLLAGEVTVRRDAQADQTFIAGRPEWAPPFEHFELDSPAAVDALTGSPRGGGLDAAWAWEDEAAGRVRARVFPVALGIDEDEATGAAAVILGARLGRPIEIRQGRGSVIGVRPLGDGRVEIGGRVAIDEVRDYDASGAVAV